MEPLHYPLSRTGKAEVLCFFYILGFSRRQYIDFTTNRKFFTLIRRHQEAFHYYEGVPKQCLYDGEKTVLLPCEAGRPVYNPAFIAFITHYHCKPIVVRRPETKGKIEAPFQYVEKNGLYPKLSIVGTPRNQMNTGFGYHSHRPEFFRNLCRDIQIANCEENHINKGRQTSKSTGPIFDNPDGSV